MSGSVPKLACGKRLRSCDSSKRNVHSDDEEKEKGKKMRDIDGKLKNVDTAPVFRVEKEKERLNNNNSEKKTPTDGYKKGKKRIYNEVIYNEVKNGKASPTSFEEKRKEKLKVSCSKKNMQTEEGVKEEDMEIWTDHSGSKRRKVSTVSYEREERRKRSNNGNGGKKIHGNGEGREENYMWNCDSKVKYKEVTVTASKTGSKKKKATNINGGTKWLQTDVEEDRNLDCRVRNGESSATFFEKGKKRKSQNSTNSEKKFQRDDKKYEKNVENGHCKVKSRKVSTTSYVKGKKKKILSHDNVDKKINGADKNTSLSFSKNKMQNNDGKKRTEPITHVVNEKKMRPYESTKMKMQHDLKHKKRNVPANMSKEKKTKVPIDCNYEKRKREESNTVFKKVKRMLSDDNKKIHSAKVTKKNCGDVDEKRNTPVSFFKVLSCNNFKKSMSIPPKVAPELEDLTNHDLYLEDCEGKFSKVRLSVVNGALAFRQGWNIFVSDHLIKWGEFLLFEYTAKSTFSVRIFSKDSRERLHFVVGRKSEGIRKKDMHTNRSHDNLILFDVESEDNENNYYFSGEYPRSKEPESHHLTVDTTEDPKRVECVVGSRPVPLGTTNGDVVIQPCRTEDMSSLRSKGKRVILITDSGSSIHENDIVKLMTSTADSGTQHVADTKEHPKRVQNGIGDRQSTLVGDEKGRLTDVDECGTKCTSKCTKKTAVSTAQRCIENGSSAVVEDEKGSLPDVECGTKCTSLKSREKKSASTDESGIENGPSAVLEDEKGSLPDVECGTSCRSPKRSKKKAASVDAAPLMHENDDTSKDDLKLHDSYEAPGGFRCLEKWRNIIARDRTVRDDTGLIKPESTRETGSKFVVEYGAVGLNPCDKCFLPKDTNACSQPIFTMPIKDPARPESVFMCEHDGTEFNHSINGKGTCAFIELQPVVPIKNPSSPDRISNCGDRRIELNDYIDGKGTITKLETKMGHLEPVGSIVGIQSTNIPVDSNNTAARQSECCFFTQEYTSSIDFLTPAKPEILTPVKPEILESDDRSVLKVNMQFYVHNTTRKWLELPKSLSNAVRGRKRDGNTVMLKDPMQRLWPVFYNESSIFVGFTTGWKPFAAANNLQTGDLCELFKELGDEEPVYSVQISKR